MDTDLKTFRLIANFIKELNDLFGEKERPIRLYSHLIERTALVHEKPIQKHISAFRNFCSENQNAILTKDVAKISINKIVYSTKVFLDMPRIFRLADKQTQGTIWEYLLTISALLDPTSKAKQILQENKAKQQEKGGKEAEFLGDIISRVEQSVDPEVDNPMAAVGSILSSGIFTDLISGMSSGLQNGDLDLGNLIGTVQKLVVGMQGSSESNDSSPNMNMLNDMMGTLNTVTNKVEEIESNPEEEPKNAPENID
jgi:hypothetical protein